MRPGQNKRMRGRNNRKGPNPLTRTYESNGPDVKIRGTAHHVAEKYLQLARDAQSSGDPVMAESYLQHAEHYFRIIAAAQLAQQQAQLGYSRPPGEADLEEADDEEDIVPDRFASPPERFSQPSFSNQSFGGQPQPGYSPPSQSQPQPQPYPDKPAFNGDRSSGQPRLDRPTFQDRGDRNASRFNPNPNRGPRDNQDRDPRPPRDFAPRQDPRPETRTRSEFEEQPVLPAFITAPVRLPVEPTATEAAAQEDLRPEAEQQEANFHLRPRRRRRPRPANADSDESPAADPVPGDLPAGE